MKIWIHLFLRIVIGIIFLQTLFFKFSASPESVYIFSTLGIEPWGRIGSGVVELFAVILLFIPRFVWMGSGIAFGTMLVAVFSHIGLLGIVVQDDGGLLFILALVSAICALVLLFFEKQTIENVVKESLKFINK